jgi:GTP pyrophosphokinase
MIRKAFNFSKIKHKGQLDDSGKDYFVEHIFNVFRILKRVTDDKEILSAGLLHDTLEDTDTDWEELKSAFSERVANLVWEVTHEGKKDEVGYYFPRLKSRDAILIKFADRLSNLSRMDSWDKKRQEQYLRKSKFWKTDN